MGLVSGLSWHHWAPRVASCSVALLEGLRSQPLKKAGGGGKRDVSGTAVSQSCWGFDSGGGPGGGA